MTGESKEMMKCATSGCGKLFIVTGRDFKFKDNEERHVRCPNCQQIYRIVNRVNQDADSDNKNSK